MIQPYPYNDPFTQQIISCCFYFIKTVIRCVGQILRFILFGIHKDIENKNNKKMNSILLHMPEHSEDISIHRKSF